MPVVRVCHLIHSLGPGGAEQVLVDLGRVSADVGMQMSVLSLSVGDDAGHIRALRDAGVEVESLGLSSRWDPRAFPRALDLVQRFRPDIVHTHLKHADLVGAVVSRRLRLPMVSTLHLIEDSVSGVGSAKRWLAGQARRQVADRTIAVSVAQRDWYLQAFPADPHRVVTVRNGVLPGAPLDEQQRRRLRAELGVPPGAQVALNIAIMRPGKGHDDLLTAVAELGDDCGLFTVLVGDGPERGRLEARVRSDPSLASRVCFAGYRPDVPAVLQAADLVVHPSHADALPTALIHALAAGLPVVATDVGGIPEVVGDGTGVLLGPRDPDGLAKAMVSVTADPGGRAAMGAAARRRFEELFHARRWAQRLLALYVEVCREPRFG
jgi:glycosyltransferase involved in cell wall biosynthesis